MEKGTLYMVPCPIADDGEMARVLPEYNADIVRSINYFVVENLRTGRRFLSRVGMGRPIDTLKMAELNEHTAPAEVEALIAPILAGENCAMISEAGCPGVADPGAALAALCHRHGVRVVPLVGPSSILLALMASGMNGQSFAFNGYLPVKTPERQRALHNLERRARSEHQSQIFIEAPYRNRQLLEAIVATCAADTRITVAVDITAESERIVTRTVAEWRRAMPDDLHKRPAIFIIGE
ncbi:MAG: SAM-dependent methyltransferase [Rikenellaceae bacterium]|nr:SAM-dependent methyltransferase [Rikenellaceae bacterium]